jgi:serine/threonine protein phosphatase PrpC
MRRKLKNALQTASASDPGIVRAFNEDSISVESELGFVVLADGMGGYKAGDVASGMATMIVTNEMKRALSTKNGNGHGVNGNGAYEDVLRGAVVKANQAIYHAAHNKSQFQGMGTTLVMALFRNGKVTIGHAGDSRLYRLRQGKLELMTVDHSLLQEQVRLGLITSDDAKVSHNRNLVTRALGVDETIQIDLKEDEARPGDVFLFCSDGLNDMVDDADIELAMDLLQDNLPLLAKQLVNMANDNGGHDNISVVVAKVMDSEPTGGGFFSRLLNWLH